MSEKIKLDKGEPAPFPIGEHECRCQYCKEESTRCRQWSPKSFICCRPLGHSGPHVACGIDEEDHPIDVWENKTEGGES